MNILKSVRAVADASGDGAIDWDAVADAAKSSTAPGDLPQSGAEPQAYAADVRDARSRIREVSGVDFDVPETLELQNRHHWIDANVATFRRAFEPLNERATFLPDLSRSINTATTAGALAFISRNVLGQYDPLLLADGEHGLYFVHPNIVRVADQQTSPSRGSAAGSRSTRSHTPPSSAPRRGSRTTSRPAWRTEWRRSPTAT